MRRIVMLVARERLHDAYDVLLPRLRGGVHTFPEDENTVGVVALGEDGELPPVADVRTWMSGLALGDVIEEDAGPDLAHALAALMPRREVGGRIVLRNPEHPAAPEGWIDVVLARGAGFGTGAHPTTRHCLELLLDVPPEGAFADLGCGAGALTIAAAKLGFAPVVGVDLLDAVTDTALANAIANAVDIDFVTHNLLALKELDVEVAVVNVSEVDVHAHIATVPAPVLHTLIVSGLDDPEQLDAALAGYAAAGLHEQRRIEAQRWPAVLLRRSG